MCIFPCSNLINIHKFSWTWCMLLLYSEIHGTENAVCNIYGSFTGMLKNPLHYGQWRNVIAVFFNDNTLLLKFVCITEIYKSDKKILILLCVHLQGHTKVFGYSYVWRMYTGSVFRIVLHFLKFNHFFAIYMVCTNSINRIQGHTKDLNLTFNYWRKFLNRKI